MKYRVKTSFQGGKTTYKVGQILSETKVSSWKNLQALINAQFLEILLEVDDNGTSNRKA